MDGASIVVAQPAAAAPLPQLYHQQLAQEIGSDDEEEPNMMASPRRLSEGLLAFPSDYWAPQRVV